MAIALLSGVLLSTGGALTDAASNLIIALVWPFTIVSFVLIFRHRVKGLLRVIEDRIRSGAGVTFGFVTLEATIVNLPILTGGEDVSPSNIALLHTSFISEKETQRINDGRDYYQFEVVLITREDVLSQVKQVKYTLPDAWDEEYRERVITDKDSRFKMK